MDGAPKLIKILTELALKVNVEAKASTSYIVDRFPAEVICDAKGIRPK